MELVLNNVYYFDEVNDVSLKIGNNRIYGIVGPSGSNKSVLVDLMNGGIDVSSGDIYSDCKIGMVYQRVEDQFFYDRIMDEFIFNLKINNVNNIVDKMNDALKIVGFNSNILNKSIYELSLSEQKRISLALVLACNPDIVILDDIFFGLDGKCCKNLIRIIRLLKIRYGKSVIIVSRDSDLVFSICDDIFLMCNGSILKTGDKYSIFKDKLLLKKCNISVPRLVNFSDVILKMKGVNIGYRNDINDLVKDIYRFVR